MKTDDPAVRTPLHRSLTDPHHLADAALEYARQGWPVLPLHNINGRRCSCGSLTCGSPAKHPRTRHGLKDATVDEKCIRDWWTQWPLANIGIVTGGASGLVVLDLDNPAAIDGLSQYGALPETRAVKTGRGKHLFFAEPVGQSLRSRVALIPGVDLRADGSFVVAPPSIHALGVQYQCVDPTAPVVSMPGWLLELVTMPSTPGGGTGVFPEGERNTRLTRVCGSLVRQGITGDALDTILETTNREACDPPLPKPEVERVARSVEGYIGRHATEMDSAVYTKEVPAERMLRFRTAAEIAEATGVEVPWVVRPWVAIGSITEVVGQPKAAGKTTWVMRLGGAALDGADFMDNPTMRTSLVYLTEERDATFREALKRANLLDRTDLHVLMWRDTQGVSWESIVEEAVRWCKDVEARLLVVDTTSQFAGLSGDTENNAGDVLKAYAALQRAAGVGLGVISIRHERKSGGDVANAGRGSSAWAGAADIILVIRRPEGNTRDTIREIHALSRFDETPDHLKMELTDDGYVVREATALAKSEARTALLASAPQSESAALSLDVLAERASIKRTVAQEAIRELIAEGALKSVGEGVKGSPRRFYASQIRSAGTPAHKAAESIGSRSEDHE